MRLRGLFILLLGSFSAVSFFAPASLGQKPPTTAGQSDIVKVDTSLVQTDVTVFDSRGNFVDELKPEQFVLKVDGRPRSISFFERVAAGSRNEEAQLAAARGGGASAPTGKAVPLDRGRMVFFFVDDVHLSPGSLNRMQSLLTRFIERDMSQNDEIAITSASGQIGFLQQLTDNQTALRKAIARLSPRARGGQDFERPVMSEYQAHLIEASNEIVLNYFVDYLLKEKIPPETAVAMVRARASRILAESAHFTRGSLTNLHNVVRFSAELPGRKLLFLISDGFYLGNDSDARQRIRELTAQAAQTGTVIYSIDARGLIPSASDAAGPGNFDPSGQLQRETAGELTASQDGLHALAADTGGRALFNTNDLSQAVTTAMKETAKYYLLAWRLEPNEAQSRKDRRVEVSVVGRPELSVRFRRNVQGSAEESSESKRKTEPQTPQTPFEALGKALSAPYQKSSLPVFVTLNFMNVAERGSLLATSMKITTASITMEVVNNLVRSEIDVAGAIFDDQGKVVHSFQKHLTIRANPANPVPSPPDHILYHDYSAIKPGLYQIRVAAIEAKDRRIGSATAWIEIPDLDTKALALSTLLVAEKPTEAELTSLSSTEKAEEKKKDPFANVALNVDHRFARTSRLRFLTFVYNAATASSLSSREGQPSPKETLPAGSNPDTRGLPDLNVQLQVFRDGEPVITVASRKIELENVPDVTRVPYAADLSLDELPPGRYILQVTVFDLLARATASQRFRFQVD